MCRVIKSLPVRYVHIGNPDGIMCMSVCDHSKCILRMLELYSPSVTFNMCSHSANIN